MLGFKRIRVILLAAVGLICGGLFSLGNNVKAATNNVGYNVSAKLPSNQIDKTEFFLRLENEF